MYFDIITDGRYFVKVKGDTEIDIPATNLKKGDKFRIYSDSTKTELTTYDDQHESTFECNGRLYCDGRGTRFIPAIVFKKGELK